MKIEDGSNFFRFDVTEQIPPEVQGTGDTRFELEVHVSAPRGNDFHGKSWAWIDANALSIFAEQLLGVHQGKSDSASVIAMSPNEFTLTVRQYDQAKHIGLFGKLGHWCHFGPEGPYWSEINFGINITDNELRTLVTVFGELCKATA